MIRPATKEDFGDIYEIINDAAIAYKDVIPADRWQDPYMSEDELQRQLDEGVEFFCWQDSKDDSVIGVMGIQDMGPVNLIRHAYVRTTKRKSGIGSLLIKDLILNSNKPILVGTWKAASWAINFYEKHGFRLTSESEKNRLLKTYWNIPERQIETSVVLTEG